MYLALWVSEGVGEGEEEARGGAGEDEEAGEPATGDGWTLTLMGKDRTHYLKTHHRTGREQIRQMSCSFKGFPRHYLYFRPMFFWCLWQGRYQCLLRLLHLYIFYFFFNNHSAKVECLNMSSSSFPLLLF